MTPEEKKAAEIDEMLKADKARRADDAGTKLDKVLSCLDGMAARMDAVERMEKSRGDAAKKSRKADASDDEDEGLDERDFGEARRLAADDHGHPATLAADAVKADAQMRCDAVAGMFGREAPKPMDGETPRNYRVRLLRPYQHNSPDYKDVPKEELLALPPAAFDAAERRIYADAMTASAAASCRSMGYGTFDQVRHRGRGGHGKLG
jgi:hypothetical protein